MKKMEIISSVYGTIIYGKVIGLKPGTGNAASRLTIVTLNEINENGQIVGGHYIKVLFWNSKNGKQKLSDRARKLKSGDLISCRVVFDAGIHSKAVGFEFKRSGLYTLAMKDEQKTYILHDHEGRSCNNRLTLVDYEKLLDYLTERTYAGDGLQETNLTGLKFTLKGVDYEVLEHTKDKYRVLMLNRKAISK